jgi:hypothetical protein
MRKSGEEERLRRITVLPLGFYLRQTRRKRGNAECVKAETSMFTSPLRHFSTSTHHHHCSPLGDLPTGQAGRKRGNSGNVKLSELSFK